MPDCKQTSSCRPQYGACLPLLLQPSYQQLLVLCRYYAEAKWMDGMSVAVDKCALRADAIAQRQQQLAQEAEQAKALVRHSGSSAAEALLPPRCAAAAFDLLHVTSSALWESELAQTVNMQSFLGSGSGSTSKSFLGTMPSCGTALY